VRRWMPIVGAVAVVGCVAVLAVSRLNDRTSASGFAIRDVAVVDVAKGISIPGQTVIVAGGRIARIGPHETLAVPQGARVIDGRGLYLMPGLVDAHVHFVDPDVFGRLMIAKGVLLVRDMGMPTQQVLPLRDALNRGEILGPEMIATGTILDGDPPLIPSVAVGIKTPAEGRAAVREHAAAGVDEIKVYSGLSRAELLAIGREARRSGLKVVGHVPDAVPFEDAVAAGLQSSEHLFGFEEVIARLLGEPAKPAYARMGSDAGYVQRLGEVDPQELEVVYQRLRRAGLTVCPTVVTFKAGMTTRAFQSGDFPLSEYVSQDVLDLWNGLWAAQDDLPDWVWRNYTTIVRGLHEAGVPLLVGTDLSVPGVIPGYAVHEEMAIWQDGGIPAADVLRSATLVPAQFMGLDDRLGSVAVGKAASLVLVRADPLKDVRNAQDIEGVFLRGEYFDRRAIGRLSAEAEDIARRSKP